MLSFKQHLAESILFEAKNVHLQHAEDAILNTGLDGARHALDAIESVAGMLMGTTHKHYNVTTKWDGSPAIFAGINPESGKFFVGTKGVFSKGNPKIIEKPSDIRKHYGDKPQLSKLLKAALEHLPKINIKGVLQGDMMFGPGDIKDQTIHGERYLTFMPNTILYAVPVDSKLAERIKTAKMGIIFHTSYSGDSFQNLKSSYNVSAKDLNQHQDVWFDDATYMDESGTATLTAEETQDIRDHVINANKMLKTISSQEMDNLLANKTFVGLIKMYINSRIRSGQHFGNIDEFVAGVEKFIHDRVEGEQTKDATKLAKKQRITNLIQKEHSTLLKVVAVQSHINDAKLALIKKLSAVNNIGTFLSTPDGFKVTSPEGFVAVDHLTNNAIKLVDRLEFSQANFARKQ